MPPFSKVGKVFTGRNEASNWLNGWFDAKVLTPSILKCTVPRKSWFFCQHSLTTNEANKIKVRGM